MKPIIVKKELEKQAGDQIHIPVLANLSGAGVTGETAALEGNEEALDTDEIVVTPDQLRHGVRWTKMAGRAVTFDMRNQAKGALARWLADKIDASFFTAMTVGTAGTDYYVMYGGDATDDDTLDASDKMTLALVSKIAFKLRDNNAHPIKDGGLEYFYLLVDGAQAYDLKQDTNWGQAQRDAQVRGANNPLFTGVIGMWDGVLIREADNVASFTNANTPAIRCARAIAFGAEAWVEGWAQEPDWVEETFDYRNKVGVATSVIRQALRGLRENSLVCVTAAVKPVS